VARTTFTFPFSPAEGCWAFPAATIAIAISRAAPSLFDRRFRLLVTDSAANKGLFTTGVYLSACRRDIGKIHGFLTRKVLNFPAVTKMLKPVVRGRSRLCSGRLCLNLSMFDYIQCLVFGAV
jgi:hypothetical protein